ncbi:ribonuclease H-like domain-containing protein [Pilobolus umbonatus]|nr:ribonuclease H-like domain-containing protein [Pilobolus umbonatus]
MEVLKKDFKDLLPVIKEAILDADFISIDTELTGLQTPDVFFNNQDDLSVRYEKIKSCVQEFTIIQFGVCTFKKNASGEYEAKPFNFYIFGSDTQDVSSRRMFSATASSLCFLRSNKFDFNKLIEEGIPFYNFSEENSMYQSTQGTTFMAHRKTQIKGSYGQTVVSYYVLTQQSIEMNLTKGGKSFLDFNRKAIQSWLQKGSNKPLLVQVNGSFYKKLIYQEVQDSKYNGFLQASQRDSNHIQIVRLKEEEKKAKSTNISPKLNFRIIIEYIREANCPVVAHNAAFDIFHTVDQFWHYLPNDLRAFKKTAKDMWPYIVDTKYLAEYHPMLKNCFDSSVLGSLYNTVEAELKDAGQNIVMAKGFERYTGSANEVAHEAGYDAYMTGVIYIALITYIKEKTEERNGKKTQGKRTRDEIEKEDMGEEENKKEEENDEEEMKTASEGNEDSDDSDDSEDGEDMEDGEIEEGECDKSDADIGLDNVEDKDTVPLRDTKDNIFLEESLLPYYGRIYLMRSDIPFLNLYGNEEEEYIPSQPNKFYLHNIPMGMTNAAIEKLYEPITPFAISWINDNNAWLILRDEAKIPMVKLGVLGLSSVHTFLSGCSRQIEGEAYGITKEASQMELVSYEQWRILYGPKKSVDYNSTASILAANQSRSEVNNESVSDDSSDPTPITKKAKISTD